MRIHNSEVDHDSVVHQLNPTEEQRRNQRAHYLANVTMIDRQVGQIMDTLEEQGYLENSVVIFTSDHGDCLTDHGHSQKWTMYEQVTKVPMIVWAPNRFKGGRQINDLVQLFDIGPAILELAGMDVPETFEAQSLLPALEGNSEWKGRELVFAEQTRDGNFTTADYMSMVRSHDWKLVHLLGETDGQLFDLQKDPGEQNNLWYSTEHAETKQALLDELLDWRLQSGRRTAPLPNSFH